MNLWKIIGVLAMAVSMAHGAEGTIQLVALVPAEKKFLEVLEDIRSQAGRGYSIVVIDVNKKTAVNEVAAECKAINAGGFILMDSKAIAMARELQQADSSFWVLPKFVFMTLLADLVSEGLGNTAGITFEVPLYTLVTNFRIISKNDFSRIGIYYRNSFARSIEESRKLLAKEKITICAVCVDCDQSQKASAENVLGIMKASADRMVENEMVELFIAPTDNLIVNSKSLTEFWLGTMRSMKMPVVATIDLLASPQLSAAVFAADPDLTQLGTQAVGQIVEHFENKTPMEKIGFEPTISIKSTLNTRVAKELNWKLKTEKLGRITKIVR